MIVFLVIIIIEVCILVIKKNCINNKNYLIWKLFIIIIIKQNKNYRCDK